MTATTSSSNSFYLTLPSNGYSQVEFPTNSNKAWKVRLPQRIKVEGRWEVGLSGISYPSDSRVRQYLNTLQDDDVLLRTTRYINKTSDGTKKFVTTDVTYKDIKKNPLYSMGDVLDKLFNEEMNNFVNALEDGWAPIQRYKTVNDKIEEVNTDLQFSVGGGGGKGWFTLYTNTIASNIGVSELHQIRVLLREDMCRLFYFVEDVQERNPYNDHLTTWIKEGRNLKKMLRFTNIGWFTKHRDRYGARISAPYGLVDVDDNGFKAIQFCVDSLSWTFTNLTNESHTRGSTPRSLYVYSSICEPQIMGNATTDLLRHVYYQPSLEGGTLFEPKSIQYVGLRHNEFDTVETVLSEVDQNSLAQFTEGATTVTLHFRRVP